MYTQPVSWGYGSTDGALGHNSMLRVVDILRKLSPFRREYLRQVAAGDKVSLFLTSVGQVLQSGRLFLHQDGPKMWKPQPVDFTSAGEAEPPDEEQDLSKVLAQPSQPESIGIKSVEAGHLAAYAVDDQGRVFAWGTRRYGQLGFADEEPPVKSDSQDEGQVEDNQQRDVDEDDHIDTSDGEEDKEEEEGENAGPQYVPLRRRDPVQLRPRLIQSDLLRGVHVLRVSAGNHFALALSSTGTVFAWGRNTAGQLGLGMDTHPGTVSTPHQVLALVNYVVLEIATGHSHSLVTAIPRARDPARYMEYSLVFAWGCGRSGRLGIGGEKTQHQPVEVVFFRGLHATQVSTGHDHSLVLCTTGSTNHVYSFGGNAFGQLGIAKDTMTCTDMPMCVDELSGLSITAIGAGAYTSAALSGDGEVHTWGDGSRGKTARPDKRTTFVPWKISTDGTNPSRFVLHDSGFVTQLSVGAHHSLALYRTDGTPDRWRKFPLGNVVDALLEREKTESSESFQAVYCLSTHASATNSAFGVQMSCEDCGLGPLCRVCVRRCHTDHRLAPVLLSDTLGVGPGKDRKMSCACGLRRPAPSAKVMAKRPTRVTASLGATQPDSALATSPDLQPMYYCKMANTPELVPENSVIW